jgi:chromosome segregation protein
VITPDGLWLGPRWLRIARDHDEHVGLLARDKEIRSLKEEIETLKEAVDTRQTLIEEQREARRELESVRDQLQQEVNQAHRTVSDRQAQLSNRQTRLEQMETRLQRVSDEMAEIRQTRERDAQALQQATRKRNEAVTRMESLAREREGLDAERDTLRQRLETVRSEARTRRDAVHQLALQVQSLTASRDATQQSLARMRSQSSQLALRLETLRESLEASGEPIAELEDTLEARVSERAALEDELARARDQVQSLEARMRETDQARVTREREAESLRQGLDELRMAWQEIKVRRQTSLEQLQESGFEADELLAQLDTEASVEAWQSRADDLAQRIQRLGAINLAAIDEYREQSERKQYLDDQYADLVEALDTLEGAIQRIDRETRSRFRETFERVNVRLKEMFPRLFGGGQAHLEMTGDDLLTTGVAVLARPPGKRLSTIHLMSGGEKALTAVALVFAIFELNPAPFCMLDEVDAPLDEANVGRFCDLVREMSERVQFIFITHNKATMEMADQLIGVTMREPGVSRLVTVDVEEAAQMAIG